MVSAAYYEKEMKKLVSGHITEKEKKRAIDSTVSVLKQFGYDSGADAFKLLMNTDNSDDRK